MPSEAVLPFEPCASPEQYATLAYGGHIFEVRSIDLGGNRDVTPASHTWWIHPPPPDTTPPDTEILSGPDPTTVQTSATFTFTGSDNQTPTEELGFQCRLDGAMDARPACVDDLHLAARRQRARAGRARAPGPRRRPGRQRRRRERERRQPERTRRQRPERRGSGRLRLDGRRDAGQEDRLLRPEDHPEHHPQQQPRRLPRPRPHRRRRQDHHRPERQDDRRQVDRRRDPQQRLRLGDGQERHPHGLRLRRDAEQRAPS